MYYDRQMGFAECHLMKQTGAHVLGTMVAVNEDGKVKEAHVET